MNGIKLLKAIKESGKWVYFIVIIGNSSEEYKSNVKRYGAFAFFTKSLDIENMKDKKIRSIVKSLTYSISGTFITILLVLILTKEIFFSIGIGLVEVIMKLIGYYFHERIWSIIKWGLKQ